MLCIKLNVIFIFDKETLLGNKIAHVQCAHVTIIMQIKYWRRQNILFLI